MSFKKPVQKFTASVNEVTLGTGDKALTIGGEKCYPFYSFDSEIKNPPAIGVEVSDLGFDGVPGVGDYYAGCNGVGEMVKRASELEGCDFICLKLDAADPNGENRSVEDCVLEAKAAAEATDKPLVIAGCKNHEKDALLFEKISEALQGKNILVFSAREENYKTVSAAAGLAYNQKVGAESSVDVNLAKQLNVLITQLGIGSSAIVMNPGSAAAGYGFEYVISTFDRIKAAGLSQNDAMLQAPIMTLVGSECWNVKEAVVSQEDMPQWGSQEDRGVAMELTTAAACLASGSNAVILRHPRSVKAASKLVKALV